MPCGECENGSCPCGTGCFSCVWTRVCGECHGTGRREEHEQKPRDSRYTWCETCSRYTRHHPERPDYAELRTARPVKYRKMMCVERCTACHAPFQSNGNRPYGYRLQEALCSST
jgi:hypothetical protein